jgi:hypothetical protein
MGQSISSHSSIDCPEDFCKFCRGLAKVAIRNGPAKGEDQANALRVEVPHHETDDRLERFRQIRVLPLQTPLRIS